MHFSYHKVSISILHLILVPFLPFLVESCSLDDEVIPDDALIKYINKDIDTNTFWNRSVVYIINKPNFQINDTLVIQAGTIIKFNPDSGRSITVTDTGYISAQGSTDKPVIFTSLFDSKHGRIAGKSNEPSVGDWDNIYICSRKNSSLYMCNFYYGGGGDTKSSISIGEGASIVIKGCTFADNDGGDLTDGNGVLDARFAGSKVIIRNNTFFNNNLPVCIGTDVNIDSTGIYHNPVDESVTNKYNAIKVVTTLPLSNSLEWSENEVAYAIKGPRFEISSKASLLIGNYAVLKFFKNTTMVLEGSNSVLRNNEGPGVVFTSLSDDSYKGDSNGDANKTIPAKGDWSLKVNDNESFEWGNIFYVTKITD